MTIKLDQFYDNLRCAERLHCGDCRGRREWRENHAAFETPSDGLIDWSCPFDVPWPDQYQPTSDEAEKLPANKRTQKRAERKLAMEKLRAHRDAVIKHVYRIVPPFGNRLTAMFESVGIQAVSGCQCKEHAEKMNEWQADLVKEMPDASHAELAQAYLARHLEDIADMLHTEAKRRKGVTSIVPKPMIRKGLEVLFNRWARETK